MDTDGKMVQIVKSKIENLEQRSEKRGVLVCIWCYQLKITWNVSYKLMENFFLLIVYYNPSIYIVDVPNILFNQTTSSNSFLYLLQRV